MRPDIEIARAYAPATKAEARSRLLVDRIWPRGVAKDALQLDAWLRAVAPSTGLRKWFNHEHGKWKLFREFYFTELDSNAEAVDECADWCRAGPVTLIYAARDPVHNHALVLRDYLTELLAGDE